MNDREAGLYSLIEGKYAEANGYYTSIDFRDSTNAVVRIHCGSRRFTELWEWRHGRGAELGRWYCRRDSND